MNQIDKNQILRMVLILLAIIGVVGVASCFRKKSAVTLDEYARQRGNPYPAASVEAPGSPSDAAPTDAAPTDTQSNAGESTDTAHRSETESQQAAPSDLGSAQSAIPAAPALTGALLNGGNDGQAMLGERLTYRNASGEAIADFYIEPLSAALQHYITGVSYPAFVGADTTPGITPDELRYVHILHYDFEGAVREGELICNQSIAYDLADIFYELYRNGYQLEKVLLVDEYGGDTTASAEDNNTFCFNYQADEDPSALSKHALGLAIDINPYYNPSITYDKQGGMEVSPGSAALYADRSIEFPYKIDENDLCYKLFVKHGFTWGGNWNSAKDYRHFQKSP